MIGMSSLPAEGVKEKREEEGEEAARTEADAQAESQVGDQESPAAEDLGSLEE